MPEVHPSQAARKRLSRSTRGDRHHPRVFRAKDDFSTRRSDGALARLGLSTRRPGAPILRPPTGLRRFRGQAKPRSTCRASSVSSPVTASPTPSRFVTTTPSTGLRSARARPKSFGSTQNAPITLRSPRCKRQGLDELVHILGDNLDRAFETIRSPPTATETLLTDGGKDRRTSAGNADESAARDRSSRSVKRDPMGRPQVAEAFETGATGPSSDDRLTQETPIGRPPPRVAFKRRSTVNADTSLGARIQRDQIRDGQLTRKERRVSRRPSQRPAPDRRRSARQRTA